MLRFCRKGFTKPEYMEVVMAEEHVCFDKNLWQNSRKFFQDNLCGDVTVMRLLPIADGNGNIICYGWQDNEANRELRMLKELGKLEDAMQFENLFLDIYKVVIYGCNELAYFFVKYLESRHVSVSVKGDYWNYMGYTADAHDDVCDKHTMAVYAENIFQELGLEQLFIRSVSPQFECVDRIYEANVKARIVKDAEGDLECLLEKLRGRKILILGSGIRAQDTYDMLYGHGIDIAAFVDDSDGAVMSKSRTLLGKMVIGLDQAVSLHRDAVFIDCNGRKSALGDKGVELMDYHGFERNKHMFLINDYADIPYSNLVHIMRGRKVLLTGDERLCALLSKYLYQIEEGNVEVIYLPPGEKVTGGEEGIRCLVIPRARHRRKDVDESNTRLQEKLLSEMEFENYTEYFVRNRAFALIDAYLNGNNEKYTIPELTPKGILLGRIPPSSGNVFFRGIMDGHPDILMISNYSDLNDHLFYYCIRLAGYDSDKVLSEFWKMYDKEAASKKDYFPDIEKFERSFERLLCYRKAFTSQELFVMFHIAYVEMMCGKKFLDVSGITVYWEPHFIPRDEFPFFEMWLEDKKVNGHTLRLRRNNVVRTGSSCERAVQKSSYLRNSDMFSLMFLEDADSDISREKCPRHHWTEYKLRFEDIKVFPQDKLLEVCEWMDIPWSDSMLRTTEYGKERSYRGSMDFDLQPVFKKSEDFLSEFDRLRISIACSPYQKKYGYTYQDCLEFSRGELQEMFLKPFFFEKQGIFKFTAKDYMRLREQIKWNLWNVRKHMVLDDISPEFERFKLKQTGRM